MPSLKGVTVHVTDHKGNDFVEWGVQHLRQQAGKCEKVSAYIQSTTDVQFRVSVQPRIPFTDKGHPGSESEPEEVEQMKGEEADQGMYWHTCCKTKTNGCQKGGELD